MNPQLDLDYRIERATTVMSRLIVGIGLLASAICIILVPAVGVFLLPCVWIVHLLDRIRVSVYAIRSERKFPGLP